VQPLMKVAVPVAWETRTKQAERDLILEQHQVIAEAIMARDPDAAVAAMEAHFDSTIGEILKDQHRII